MTKTPPLYIRLILFAITLLWFAGALLPFYAPMLPKLAYLLQFAHMIYAPVCHQLTAKLFCLGGACTLVCSRCTGIYAGFVLSSLVVLVANPVKFKDIKLLFYSAIPLMLDVVFSSVGAYKYNEWIAAFTGMVFGYAAFYYLYKGIFQLVAMKRSNSVNVD